MNSPKCRISDIKVILAKCETLDDPILLKEALYECIAMLDNHDIQIVKAVEQLRILYQHIKLDIEVNTNVTISKELFDFIKDRISNSNESVKIIFNSDDCIFNGLSIIDSLNLTNIVKITDKKLILVVDDSPFNLKVLYQKIKTLLFPDEKIVHMDFSGNYTIFENETYIVVFCKNGKTAYEVFKSRTPFAIITDNDMPFMNGHDMSALILESDKNSKILMISGNSIQLIEDLINKYPGRINFLDKGTDKSTFSKVFTKMFIDRIDQFDFISDLDMISR